MKIKTIYFNLANPAYQNMLRSNEMSSTFGMSQHLEDDDELDKMVSPKPNEMECVSNVFLKHFA